MLNCLKMMGSVLLLAMLLSAQTSPRFPAPLGIDRVLTGIVIDCTKSQSSKSKRDPQCGKNSGYMLKVEDTVYTLHGYEDELAAHRGKTTTITGHVVENTVTVTSVRAPEK